MRKTLATIGLALSVLFSDGQARAWGPEGHAVIAKIAYSQLNPKASAAVDYLLAVDHDALTGRDLPSRAAWADVFAKAHPDTAPWHFVNIQLDDPSLESACEDVVGQDLSQNCIVRRIKLFEDKLAAPNSTLEERVVAFKFIIHLVGDVHQPLHAADNRDFSGGCLPVAIGSSRTTDLLHYWDQVTVDELGGDPSRLATRLTAEITPADRSRWNAGEADDWALESFTVAKSTAYDIGGDTTCSSDAAPVFLSPSYAASARRATELQLKRAGIRLAGVLNRIFSAPSFSLTDLGGDSGRGL